MRTIVWLLILSVAAVVAATSLGANDGLVSIYWLGWRTDLSLNFFLFTLVVISLGVYSLVRGLDSLLGLPERARRWRTSQRDRGAQAALREALSMYLAGRYSRANKAAQRAVGIQSDSPDLAPDTEFAALAHLLSAGSLHRLQDRKQRDEHLQRALDLSRLTRKPRAVEEGARLMAAEFAVEDQDVARAQRTLAELPAGVARRTQALRLRLSASRLARQPLEGLRTARLLAKHQGFTPVAAEGLIRSLASEALSTARDTDQLRQVWLSLDGAERQDPLVVARAATRMARLGAPAEARAWLAPLWERLPQMGSEAVDSVALALAEATDGLETDWLARLDRTQQTALRAPALALATGLALCERQLWGKARTLLMSAASDRDLHADRRRQAYVALARLAEQEQKIDEAQRFWREAALMSPLVLPKK
ncbi:heme biosynthesis protein HemY [Aquabacterium lacunae]|uniref:Heme biosynthesis protein HemY n=1 Tax=Aquabacterium lacunae TaxID=2528630 RepID=A0A4Q9H696_9BURK|nr:heme biosynthesis HemY N-terminal domain-containing protein [Aquabacterium lacunae]TBO34387.1 heme biosynthesis protein HemY [Aquabacterium lacunae]